MPRYSGVRLLNPRSNRDTIVFCLKSLRLARCRNTVGEAAWKRLQVLPRQTVLESAQLNFPPVNAETLFLIQWIASSNRYGADSCGGFGGLAGICYLPYR